MKEDTLKELRECKLVPSESDNDTIKRLIKTRRFFIIDGKIVEVISNERDGINERGITIP